MERGEYRQPVVNDYLSVRPLDRLLDLPEIFAPIIPPAFLQLPGIRIRLAAAGIGAYRAVVVDALLRHAEIRKGPRCHRLRLERLRHERRRHFRGDRADEIAVHVRGFFSFVGDEQHLRGAVRRLPAVRLEPKARSAYKLRRGSRYGGALRRARPRRYQSHEQYRRHGNEGHREYGT